MIGLIACSKTKLDRAAPARELYTSPLFRLSLAYAEARCGRVYVASAQHDMLELDRVLSPYNRTMTSLTPMQRKLFGAAVARGLVDRQGSAFELLVLAGAAYVAPIRAAFQKMGAEVRIIEPLAGKQIGERLSFLTASGRSIGGQSPPDLGSTDAVVYSKPDARPVSTTENP